MSRNSIEISPWATRALYLFGAVLIVMPLLDLGSTVLPARPGDFSWRYGVLGLMAGYLHTPMIGLVLMLAVGWWEGRSWVLRLGGILSMAASVGLLAVMAVFALDVLQMRGMRPEEVQSVVLAGGAIQELKYLTAALVLAPLGYGSFRTAAHLHRRGQAPAEAAPGIMRAR